MLVSLLYFLAFGWAPDKWPAPDEKEKDRIYRLFVAELVPLTPGRGKFPASFTMGSDAKDAPKSEKPALEITLKYDFAISKYEVTQELYVALVGSNPARWKGPRNSVEMVSWEEARAFCKLLTAELRKRKLIQETEVIRLPSEAEWEYACRAGTTTEWSFGDALKDLTNYCWYADNSRGFDPAVGQKKPNPWGIHEMHGYVWEWTDDVWSPSHQDADRAGKARSGETKERVLRGGGFSSPSDQTRSATRIGKPLDTRNDAIGFRCVKAAANEKE